MPPTGSPGLESGDVSPHSLIEIEFSGKQNESDPVILFTANIIPPNVKILGFGLGFNQSFIDINGTSSHRAGSSGINMLPSNLTHLHLDKRYNKPLLKSNGDRILPLSLKELSFHNGFYFGEMFEVQSHVVRAHYKYYRNILKNLQFGQEQYNHIPNCAWNVKLDGNAFIKWTYDVV
jgi:hypothetical protein